MREIVSQAKDVEARGENKEKELLYSFVVYDMNDLPPPAPHDKWRRRQDLCERLNCTVCASVNCTSYERVSTVLPYMSIAREC